MWSACITRAHDVQVEKQLEDKEARVREIRETLPPPEPPTPRRTRTVVVNGGSASGAVLESKAGASKAKNRKDPSVELVKLKAYEAYDPLPTPGHAPGSVSPVRRRVRHTHSPGKFD